MPQLDRCYDQVVHALQKDGWKVEPKPFLINIKSRRSRLLADIEAVRSKTHIIVAEVKRFEDDTPDELYTAFGQHLIYPSNMLKAKISYPLYLAVPSHAYHGIFMEMATEAVAEIKMRLIIVDITTERIEQWIR